MIFKELKELREEIMRLKQELDKYKLENSKLTAELENLKPILNTPNLRPAVSYRCKYCKFAAINFYNNNLVGCLKDCVCEDFEEVKNERSY